MSKTAAETNQAIASRLSNNLARLLREFSRDFDRRICEGLVARGHTEIRPSHSIVFANLGMGDVRVTELARRSQVTQQAMGKILKELERLDYIKRDIDDKDKRAREVRLTERGMVLAQDSLEIFNQTREDYAKKIGVQQLEDLEHNLRSAVRQLHLHNMPNTWADL